MSASGKINYLQDLRGFAVLFVLLYHATTLFTYNGKSFLYGVFNQGFLGVDLFFVISGFIIYHIHNNDIGDNLRLNSYLLKRFNRIFPLCWVVLIALIPVYFAVPSFGSPALRSPAVIIKSLLLIPQNDYLLNVTWTLTYELIFYVMFAILIGFPKRISFPLVATWATLSILCFIHPFWQTIPYVNNLVSPYNVEFFCGCLIAYLIKKNKISQGLFFLIVGVLALLFFWTGEYMHLVKTTREIAYGIPCAFIVLGSISLEKRGIIKSNNYLRLIGDASYSIYLIHAPILSALNKVLLKSGFNNIYGMSIIVIVTLLLGCIFYWHIERPLLMFLRNRRFKNKESIPNAA